MEYWSSFPGNVNGFLKKKISCMPLLCFCCHYIVVLISSCCQFFREDEDTENSLLRGQSLAGKAPARRSRAGSAGARGRQRDLPRGFPGGGIQGGPEKTQEWQKATETEALPETQSSGFQAGRDPGGNVGGACVV